MLIFITFVSQFISVDYFNCMGYTVLNKRITVHNEQW